MLLLDEPDAHLDQDGERALAEALTEARDQGVTIIAVTQRKQLTASADKVIVVRDGMAQVATDISESAKPETGRVATQNTAFRSRSRAARSTGANGSAPCMAGQMPISRKTAAKARPIAFEPARPTS